VRRLVWLVGLSHATNHFVMLVFPRSCSWFSRNLTSATPGSESWPAPPSFATAWPRCRRACCRSVWGRARPGCLAAGFRSGVPRHWFFDRAVDARFRLGVLGLFASLHHPAAPACWCDCVRGSGRTSPEPSLSRGSGKHRSGRFAYPRCGDRRALGVAHGVFLSALPGWLLVLPLWRIQVRPPQKGGGVSARERAECAHLALDPPFRVRDADGLSSRVLHIPARSSGGSRGNRRHHGSAGEARRRLRESRASFSVDWAIWSPGA